MTVWSLFYNSFLLQLFNEEKTKGKQQANKIIITVAKEQKIMTTESLRSKREVIKEDTKKLKT